MLIKYKMQYLLNGCFFLLFTGSIKISKAFRYLGRFYQKSIVPKKGIDLMVYGPMNIFGQSYLFRYWKKDICFNTNHECFCFYNPQSSFHSPSASAYIVPIHCFGQIPI